MISKNTIKLIKSLARKKFRLKEKLFLVEGDKNVLEALNSNFTIENVFATNSFILANKIRCKNANEIIKVEQNDIKKASLLQSPQNCLALCTIPEKSVLPEKLSNNLSIYLDDIQDPGNLGTIIRICDWFNIENIFCSLNTTDFFNPKVIQASMGSFCRVNYFETDFTFIADLAHKNNIEIFGAFMDGNNIYTEKLPQKAIIVMGNEGNGINKDLVGSINRKLKIPKFSENGAESLNVSVATAIICSEFKRQMF